MRSLRQLLAAFLLSTALIPRPVAAQQGGTTSYIYDDNGRLHAVITPSGDAVIYNYDAAGNFTSIQRATPNTLALFSFSPQSGLTGDLVTFVGIGLSTPSTTISFNGAAAVVTSSGTSFLVAQVPTGATTGPVIITTATGSVVTPTSFAIQGVRVSPKNAQVLLGNGLQFTVNVQTGTSDNSVVWSVNGIQSGNASLGTISGAGLYSTGLNATTVTIRATSVAVPGLFDEAQLSILDPANTQEPRTPAVSVNFGPSFGNSTPLIPAVAIQFGNSATILPGVADTIMAPVAVTTGPTIAGISPSTTARSAGVVINIAGANLNDATSLRFIDKNNAFDSNITASNVTAAADGSSLSATLNVGPSATSGLHVVVIASPNSGSLTISTGLNLITVTP